jgi:secreted trypsin-like serine protease
VIGVAILASLALPALALASSGSIRPATARLVPRIVGGTPAPAGTFPWLAFILYNVSPAGFSYCSGTVVSSNVVLTAGHCAEDPTTGSLNPPGGYAVIRGSHAGHRLSGIQPHNWPGRRGAAGAPHTDDGSSDTAGNSKRPRPARTGHTRHHLRLGTDDWRRPQQHPNSTPTALQWATTVVQSPATCSQVISPFDPYTQVCAINAPSFDTSTCFGDSGGPLLANDLQGQNGDPIEIGISVQVLNNCDTALPDMYTRVDVVSPWANDGQAGAAATAAAHLSARGALPWATSQRLPIAIVSAPATQSQPLISESHFAAKSTTIDSHTASPL